MSTQQSPGAAAHSAVLAWVSNRTGNKPVGRRVYRLLDIARAMTEDHTETFADEIEAFCKDLDEVAAAMRKVVKTNRRITALSNMNGRTADERRTYEAKIAALRASR